MESIRPQSDHVVLVVKCEWWKGDDLSWICDTRGERDGHLCNSAAFIFIGTEMVAEPQPRQDWFARGEGGVFFRSAPVLPRPLYVSPSVYIVLFHAV